MRRSRVVFLAVVLAAVLWGAGVAPMIEREPAVTTVSVRLTDAEAGCIVGGQACLGEMASAYGGCVIDNFNPDDPSTMGAFVGCIPTGLWAGVVCAVTWLWGLFF